MNNKLKLEYLPILSIIIFIVVFIIFAVVDFIIVSNIEVSADVNYQMNGKVEEASFEVLRAYYKGEYLIIENEIKASDGDNINSHKIYYEVKTDLSDEVLGRGYLTNKIKIRKNKVNADSNIVIDIYSIINIEDVRNSDPYYRIVIDKDEIDEYIDVLSNLKNYNSLDDKQIVALNKYLSDNYMNDKIVEAYNLDVQEFIKPYIVAPEKQQILELNKLITVLLDKYEYYLQVADLVGVNLDKWIKNTFSTNTTASDYNSLKMIIGELNSRLNKKIKMLESKGTKNNINLEMYYKNKDSYPLTKQYEYLDKKINGE